MLPICYFECPIPVEFPGQVLEPELVVLVAPPLRGREPLQRGSRRHGQRGRDAQLRHEAGADVDVAEGHDRLVHVVVDGQLEALAALRAEPVVVDLGVEQDGEAVLLAQLDARPDRVRVVGHDRVEGDRLQLRVERDLRLDQRADAVVRAEERQQAGEGARVLGDALVGRPQHAVLA